MLSTPTHRAAPDAGRLLSITTLPGTLSGQIVAEVTGEVDTFTAPALEVCLHSQAAKRGLRVLVVDLARVTFLGAAGVTALAQSHHRCRMRGARLVIRSGGRRSVLLPLQSTGLADLVPVDPPELERISGPGTAVRPRTPVRWTPPRHPRRVRR